MSLSRLKRSFKLECLKTAATDWLHFDRSTSPLWQILVICLAWLYLCSLHWHNDGLWFQGDSPRHASNAIFWKDFLLSVPVNPKEFALSFYARYPVIDPIFYPPFFYFLEGALFGLFGASPFLAKGLVLCFALVAALYTSAWIRRWIALEAGWAGALVLLSPGIVTWSHAVMLNVPAYALTVAYLYHTREWFESQLPRQFHLMLLLGLLAILTYYQAGVIVFITCVWLIALRRWHLLKNRRVFLPIAVIAILLLPSFVLVFKWAPIILGWLTPKATLFWSMRQWAFYPNELPRLLGLPIAILAIAGACCGLRKPRWRHETVLLTIWIATTYFLFSTIKVLDARYILALTTPFVCLSIIFVLSTMEWLKERFCGRKTSVQAGAAVAICSIVVVQAWLASEVKIHNVKGFEEVAVFLEHAASDELVLYDGRYDGIFTFNVLARDRDFQRGVVLADKLLDGVRFERVNNGQPYDLSPQSVLEVLKTRAGCEWLAVMVDDQSEMSFESRCLRDALGGPQFKLVKSFPIISPRRTARVDLYHLLIPVEKPGYIDIPFKKIGNKAIYRIRPISKKDR